MVSDMECRSLKTFEVKSKKFQAKAFPTSHPNLKIKSVSTKRKTYRTNLLPLRMAALLPM